MHALLTLLVVGHAAGGLVTDHRDAVAWDSAPGQVTVVRDGRAPARAPLPAGCRLAWVTTTVVAAGCGDPVERPLLVDLATGMQTAAPGDPGKDVAFTIQAVGTRWIQGTNRSHPVWIDRATGAARSDEDAHHVADLDSPGLFTRLCRPLARRRFDGLYGSYLTTMQVEGRWALDNHTRLRRCGRTKATKVPAGSALAPGWLATPRAVRRLRDGRRFVIRPKLPAHSKVAVTRRALYALKPDGTVLAAKLPG